VYHYVKLPTVMPALLVTLFVLLVLAVVIFAPLVFIWAINTLFSLQIAYTFINWFAAFVLLTLVGKPSVKSKK